MNPFATLPSHFRFFGSRKTTSRRRPCTAIERAVSTVVERLEGRQLLSSSILVNSTLDNVSDSSVSGSTVTLREAVNYENANGGGMITFAPGLTATGAATITLTQTGDGTAGPSALGIGSNITIQGPTSGNGITIAGNGSQRLFYVASGGTLSLNDLTLTGGNATGGSSNVGGGAAGLGGAVFSQGTVNIYQSTLAGNSAAGGTTGDQSNALGGGGMGGHGGDPNGVDSAGDSNGGGPNGSAAGQNGGFGGGGGGGAYNVPYAGSGGFGGGGGGPSGGSGGFGGGGGSGGGRRSSNGGFGGGTNPQGSWGGAGGGMGGAIFNAAGSLSIIDSTLTSNTATGGNVVYGLAGSGSGFGGAVFNLNGSLTLTGDTFAANTVVPGVSQLRPDDNNFRASANGTDVYTLGLANVVAYVGGPNIGPANGASSATLTDNLFVNGTGGADLVVNNGSGNSTVTGTNNLDTGSTGLPAGVSTTTTSAALKLGALSNNGGTTQTIPLLTGSSAIGAGIISGVATDQRGYGFTTTPSTIDVGAYQSAAIAPETPGLFVNTAADATNAFDGVTSLREAIAYADSLGGGTITFASNLAGQTITLGGSQLELTATANPVVIDAASIGGITISGNNASRVFRVDGGATVTLNGLTLINGAAINDLGGGIYNAGTLTAANDTIASNSAYGGGGIYNVGKLTATTDTITGNSATQGGGICNEYSATVTAANDTIVNNSASNAGGGISNSGTLVMTSDTIASNSASGFAGGIANSGTVTSTNDTFVSNSAVNAGGGISNYAAMMLTNDTVVNNSANDGGGIWNANNKGRGSSGPAPLTVSNTLVVGNTSPGLPDLPGTVINRGGNLIGLPANYTLGQVVAVDSNGKPLLASNGGPTQTIALVPGSPAINAGSNALAVDANGNALTTDQRGVGYARIVGGIVDIGAYESPVVITTTTVSDAGGTYNGNPFPATGSTTITGTTTAAGTPTFTYYLAGDTGFARPLTGAPTNAGNYVVVASFAAQGNYLASSSSMSFSITPAAPTVTAIDSSGPYNGNPFAASSTVTDLTSNPLSTGGVTYIYYTVPGGDPTRLPRIGVSNPPTDAGSYAVVAHYPGSTDGNYAATDSRPPTYFTIAQISPTISIAAPSKVYTGAVYAPTISVTGLGGVSLGTPTIQYFLRSDPTQLSPMAAPTVAGAYTVVVSYAGSTDYLSATQSVNFNITQASPGITSVNPVNITYGTALTNSQLTGTTSTPGSFSYTTASGTKPNAGNGQTVSVTFTPTDSLNYSSITSAVVVNVAKATPTVGVTDGGGTYSGNPFAAGGTINGASILENVGVTFDYINTITNADLGATAPSTVGSYKVFASFAGSTDYTAASSSMTFGIGKAPSNTSVTDNGGTYSGNPFAASGTVTGIGGLTASPSSFSYVGINGTTYGPSATAPSNAGSYTVTDTYNGDANHSGSANSTNFTIAKFKPVISTVISGGTYNGSPFAGAAYLVGVTGYGTLNLENVTPTQTYYAGSTATGTPLSGAPTAAGTYTVVSGFAGSADYSSAVSTPTTFTIGKASPTLNLSAAGGVYNAAASNATATVTGISGPAASNLEGVTPTLTYYAGSTATGTPLSAAPINVGTYTVVENFAGSANYSAAAISKTFSITQASSTISVPAVTVTYGGTASLFATLMTSGGAVLANRTVTFTFNGKVIGTAVTNASGVATLSASAAGINPGVINAGVQASFAGDANSTATSASNSLTVTDAAIVAKGTTLNLLNVALTLGTFTQPRTGAAAGDYVVTVNWGDGSALQQATVVADLFHPGQFNIVGPLHLYKKLFTTYAVTVTISTAAKFGASAGATTTFTTSILA